ncbi:pentatricopeptide repeat-containing protein At5g66520 [Abrus precatorius]|uniref:Pentatricopeptide repeat-containing protein At5g66520 n=1 Tax=Abrus precatorius TaxID=3816 RepID=A0A8B8M3U9_ABRPR|nr:pentatricopeptide repeat-containing protein At5g66520 [Abrus precatorius]
MATKYIETPKGSLTFWPFLSKTGYCIPSTNILSQTSVNKLKPLILNNVFFSFTQIISTSLWRIVRFLCTMMVAMLLQQPNAEQTQALLEKCSNIKELKQIHGQLLKKGVIRHQITLSKLLASYASIELGNLVYARMVFDRISSPNTVMWNTMIRAYSNSNDPEAAVLLYHEMLHHPVPHNAYTFPFLLKACSALSAFEETQQIHAHIFKRGFGSEVHATNSLLHAYAISGNIQYAQVLFNRLRSRDIVSWNTMIDGYIKFGNLDMANKIFQAMPVKNVISWTTMIVGFVRTCMHKEALSLLQQMLVEGIKPDSITLSSSLSACAGLGALEQGEWIHTYIEKYKIKIDAVLGCVLIDMYVKCGEMEKALSVFSKLKKKGVCAWTAIIGGFAVHGKGKEAIDWFIQMQKAGIKPTSITFTAILTACSHAGLTEEGKSLFERMNVVYNINPSMEHYGCMVDLLGRAGLLEEAKEFIGSMPIKPNATIWGALLHACHLHKNFELGKEIGKVLIELDPDHGGRYIHLASVYAAAGEWNQAVRVRSQIKHRGLVNLPGCSSITLNGVVHEFFAGASSHPHILEIYDMPNLLPNR